MPIEVARSFAPHDINTPLKWLCIMSISENVTLWTIGDFGCLAPAVKAPVMSFHHTATNDMHMGQHVSGSTPEKRRLLAEPVNFQLGISPFSYFQPESLLLIIVEDLCAPLPDM